MANSTGVAIVGCGNISEHYVHSLLNYPDIHLLGVTDIDLSKAYSLADRFGVHAYPDLHTLLQDKQVELVVNLTLHKAHYAVTRQCLEAGKHVFSEKPLAMTTLQAKELVDLAAQNGVRLGVAPISYMGEAQQTAWKYILEGKLGVVRLIYAEVNWGRIETWHPNPEPFYEVGPLFDVGVYPLTLLTAFFGPIHQVTASGRVIYPQRVNLEGKPFHIDTPDLYIGVIEFKNGILARLTANFYVGLHSKQSGVEFHGDLGSLYLSSWHDCDAQVEYSEYGGSYQPVSLIRPPFSGPRKVDWGRGANDMVESIRTGTLHRATGEHGAHIVEVMNAMITSMNTHQPVLIQSSFPAPSPMPWNPIVSGSPGGGS